MERGREHESIGEQSALSKNFLRLIVSLFRVDHRVTIKNENAVYVMKAQV